MTSVLITGCSSGIGHATALMLDKAGYRVYATARNLDSIADLAEAGCKTLQLDVTDQTSCETAIAAALRDGPIDVLVNNAGFGMNVPVEEVADDALRSIYETNVFGVVRMCKLVLPSMRKQKRGRIINISSMGGRLTTPGNGVYHSTKYALEALSDSMRYEVRGFGVKVVLIEPGIIQTNWARVAEENSQLDQSSPYYVWERKLRGQLDKTYSGNTATGQGTPEDVAEVIQHAIEARKPRTRYTVTSFARFAITARWLVPGRVWDFFLRRVFPKPPK